MSPLLDILVAVISDSLIFKKTFFACVLFQHTEKEKENSCEAGTTNQPKEEKERRGRAACVEMVSLMLCVFLFFKFPYGCKGLMRDPGDGGWPACWR